MAASVVAASRTFISSGLAATSSAVPRSVLSSSSSASASPGRFASFGKGLLNPAFGGAKCLSQRRSNLGGCRASATASSFRAFSLATVEASSTIKIGEKLPEGELSYLDKDSNVQTVKVSELTEGKKVVLFAVPGAFTPTCSQKHVPEFVAKAEELKAKGIDTIACISVNDVFVLKAWGETLGVGDKVLLLSDGNVNFTKALGVQLDLSDKPVGLGIRSRRYALLADNGVVKQLNLEEGGAFSISGPEEILKAL